MLRSSVLLPQSSLCRGFSGIAKASRFAGDQPGLLRLIPGSPSRLAWTLPSTRQSLLPNSATGNIMTKASRSSILRGAHRNSSTASIPTAAKQTKTAGIVSGVLQADRAIGYWLLSVGGAVFLMVVLGGITRLTRSGLSMTEWKIQGSRLPNTLEEWENAFAKYKAFPEYLLLNRDMQLDEFKRIYFMEWFHRMWGRFLGVVYGVPLIYFVASGRAAKLPGMRSKLVVMFALGGAQGLIGWWMVKSGLEAPTENKEPRVSPYRLAGHLTMATVLYSMLVWTGLTSLNPNRITSPSTAMLKAGKWGAIPSALVAITFFSGAFVAGNAAGLAYNDWPKYAGNWIPTEIWDDKMEPAWRNLLENTATVQFNHRNLAYTTATSILALFVATRRPHVLGGLPGPVRLSLVVMLGAVAGQVTLGITTLMWYVPVSLGSAHQAGALTLWTTVLYFNHALRYVRP